MYMYILIWNYLFNNIIFIIHQSQLYHDGLIFQISKRPAMK